MIFIVLLVSGLVLTSVCERGNFDINVPYMSGTRCGDCSKTCDKGLCDCGSIVCENAGTLDQNICKCSCKQQFHVGEQCKLDCRNLTKPYMCGTGSYNKQGCVKYSSTVPFDCPNTCGVCPAGGYTYKEGSWKGNGSGTGDNNGNSIQSLSVTFVWMDLFFLFTFWRL